LGKCQRGCRKGQDKNRWGEHSDTRDMKYYADEV
jgi:hypothetical protein